MEESNCPQEPLPYRPSGEGQITPKPDLIARLHEERAKFGQLQAEFAQFRSGYSGRLNEGLQVIFGLDNAFRQDADESLRLTNLEFFACNRQKPDKTNLLRHIAYFLADARTEHDREKWLKPAAVLESFRSQGVPVQDVAKRLKEERGYARIYNSITMKRSAEKAVGEDLDLLRPDSDPPEEPKAHRLSCFEARDEVDDPSPSIAWESSSTIIGSDAQQSDEATSGSDASSPRDHLPLERAASSNAATEKGDTINGQPETAGPPERCPLHSAAKKDHVAVRVEPWQVLQALAAKRVIFFADVIQPIKDGGHVDVVARRVVLLATADGPWPELNDARPSRPDERPAELKKGEKSTEVLGLPGMTQSTPHTAMRRVDPSLFLSQRTSRSAKNFSVKPEVSRNLAGEKKRSRRPADARAEPGPPCKSTP